jgi:multiple sugar transport system permease protein
MTTHERSEQQPQNETAPWQFVRDKFRRRRRVQSNALFWAAIFLIPAIIALITLRIVPLIGAFRTALVSESGENPFGVFEYVLTDPGFINSLKVTLIFSIIVNPLQIGLAMWLAVVLVKHIPFVGLWRTLILLPIAIPQ